MFGYKKNASISIYKKETKSYYKYIFQVCPSSQKVQIQFIIYSFNTSYTHAYDQLQNTNIRVYKGITLPFYSIMTNSLSIFIIFICTLLQFSTCHQKCPPSITTEIDLLKLDVQCFLKLYDPETHDGNKLARMIDQQLDGFKKIRKYLKMRNIKAIETTPVVKWAQNEEQIFINFRLSHRQDSPPCSDVNFEQFSVVNIENVTGGFETKHLEQKKNINLQNETSNFTSGFSFTGECYFTNQKFFYSLNMTFNSSISSVNIERQGLGDYILVASKTYKTIWIDPFEDVHKAAIWPELRSKYEADMDKYFSMREERFEQNNQRKSRKKRKRRPVASSQNQQSQGDKTKWKNVATIKNEPEGTENQQQPNKSEL